MEYVQKIINQEVPANTAPANSSATATTTTTTATTSTTATGNIASDGKPATEGELSLGEVAKMKMVSSGYHIYLNIPIIQSVLSNYLSI